MLKKGFIVVNSNNIVINIGATMTINSYLRKHIDITEFDWF